MSDKPVKRPARCITDGSKRWFYLRGDDAVPGGDLLRQAWLKNEEAWFQRHWWRRVYRRVVLLFGGRP